jgi:Holliday junction resolvase
MVVKANGDRVRLSMRKLVASIRRAGATDALARSVGRAVASQVRDGMSTRAIQQMVDRELGRRRAPGPRMRYSLKEAMRRLGPAGYDFERFVSAVLQKNGYDAMLPEILPGECVNQEVDVVAKKGNVVAMVECKYRNTAGIHVHLKDVMATYARLLDVQAGYRLKRHRIPFTQGWLVCNTRVTSEGTKFGECHGMKIIGWRYPENHGLEMLIESTGSYPVTILRSVTRPLRSVLASAGLILVQDFMEQSVGELTKHTGIPITTLDRIRREVESSLYD